MLVIEKPPPRWYLRRHVCQRQRRVCHFPGSRLFAILNRGSGVILPNAPTDRQGQDVMVSPYPLLYNPRASRATVVLDMIRLAVVGFSSLFAVSAMANPIHDAARAGDVVVVTSLLNQGMNIEDREPTGETPQRKADKAWWLRIHNNHRKAR